MKLSKKRFVFYAAALPPEAFNVARHMRQFECDEQRALDDIARLRRQQFFRSDTYQVALLDGGSEAFTQLSIKRVDREPILGWREKQRIKNAIVGEEREALELFPAESRLVDTSNQYWLWVLPAGERLPCGFGERLVMQQRDHPRLSQSKQEPFDDALAGSISKAQELRRALHSSLRLQSHYAELLNGYDGGDRRTFATVEEWLNRMIEVG